ncbi:Oligomerization domain-containing protein [Dissophora ornata]|nr:Oligomerization domain-containing protein [Dissophora ornata]
MVGNEGLETIDPKDFPELYPGEDDIEGLSQESHPDNERDFENLSKSSSKSASVLLSDKERSEEEFSWFVDDSFPEKAAAGSHQQIDDAASSDFIPLWQKNAQRSPGDTEIHKDDHLEHSADSVAGLVKLIESERAKNVKVIDMRDKCDWTEWMVIAEGLSERHLGNVADQVYSALKKSSPKTNPPVMEGRDTSNWVVIDAGSVVIHFMTPEARKERDLEGLWASVKNPLKLKDVEEISWDDVKGKMTKSWKENPGRSRGEDGKRGRRGEKDIPLSEVVKW